MEKWMAIPGYEGLYEVSDKGNFRSLDRVVTKRNGTRVRYKGREVALDYGKRNAKYNVRVARPKEKRGSRDRRKHDKFGFASRVMKAD